MYKVRNGLHGPLISDTFKLKNSYAYNLSHNPQFSRPLVKTVFYGTESISYLGPVIWDILHVTYKDLPNLDSFKNRIKKWKPKNCPCRLCKTYVMMIKRTGRHIASRSTDHEQRKITKCLRTKEKICSIDRFT